MNKKLPIEKLISDNVIPVQVVGFGGCINCAFYDLESICEKFSCLDYRKDISVFWTSPKVDEEGKPILSKNFIQHIGNESKRRVKSASRAVFLEKFTKQR